MNPVLDRIIERFREAQDTGVSALARLGIPRPRSNVEWPIVCIDHNIHRRCRIGTIQIYTHGFGIELKIGELTIDFDWGEDGESDGFDAWRLYNFTLDNGGTVSHDDIQAWIDESLTAGELTRSGPLYYDPKRRAFPSTAGESEPPGERERE